MNAVFAEEPLGISLRLLPLWLAPELIERRLKLGVSGQRRDCFLKLAEILWLRWWRSSREGGPPKHAASGHDDSTSPDTRECRTARQLS